MTCPEEGRWQAWLDGELDGVVREGLAAHLTSCPACRRTVAELEGLARQQHRLLGLARQASEAGDRTGADPEGAWQAFLARLAATGGSAVPVPAPVPAVPATPAAAPGRRRRWLGPVAAAAALALALALPTVRAATAGLFRVFRVEQVQVVPFTPGMEAELRRALQGFGDGHVDLREFGELTVEAAPPERLPAAEAVRRGGFPPLPARLGDVELRDAILRPRMELRMVLRTAAINRLLAQVGSPERVPAELDGRPIRVTVPAELTADYRGPGGRWVQVIRLRAPEIVVPEGVDVERARRAVLSLPFLPGELRRALERAADWRTAVLPVDARWTPERVELGAVEAWVLSPHPGRTMVLWLERGIVTVVDGGGDRPRVLALARALREGSGR